MFGSTATPEPSKSLGVLNTYRTNRFQLSDLNLNQRPLKSELWFPEHLTPWAYLPGYRQLSRAMQIRYNQLYALGTNEAFIALERDFICAILRDLVKPGRFNEALSERLQSFIDEEEKHADMFFEVNRAAEPDFYQSSAYHLTAFKKLSPVFWLRQIGAHHRLFSVWPWIAIFFEERSLMYSKEHLRTPGVAPLFVQCHKLHMLEEIYHVQLDELIIDEFYSAKTILSRRVAGTMLREIVKSYVMPRRLSHMIVQQMNEEFPDAKDLLKACLKELPLLATNREFRQMSFGPDATKRFRKLLTKYPEMAPVEALIKL